MMGSIDVARRGWRIQAGGCLVGVALLMAGVTNGPVSAAEGEGCAAAAWSFTEDGARLRAARPARVDGGALALSEPTAVVVSLLPTAEARLPLPPERRPAADTFAGYVTLEVPPAGGVLQVTLAQAAWIDLIREGEALKPLAFTGVRNCPLARKSVRFLVPAGAGPWVLQLSGAPENSVALAVSLVP